QATEAEAQLVLDDASRTHAHADLRDALVLGAPCPVCDQEVQALPPKLRAAALTRARKALDTARRTRERAEQAARTALDGLTRAGTRWRRGPPRRDRNSRSAWPKQAMPPGSSPLNATPSRASCRRVRESSARGRARRYSPMSSWPSRLPSAMQSTRSRRSRRSS